MASVTGSATSISVLPRCSRQSPVVKGVSGLKLISFSNEQAKPETVEKVCDIVKEQLALPDGIIVTGESNFAALGADSLDTVEIVMGLEEAFGITVEEDSAPAIKTVQDAADLIEDLVKAKLS